MHDVANFQESDNSAPSLNDLVLSLNVDQARIFLQVKTHLEHQVQHERDMCKCSDFIPLHMFICGVGNG